MNVLKPSSECEDGEVVILHYGNAHAETKIGNVEKPKDDVIPSPDSKMASELKKEEFMETRKPNSEAERESKKKEKQSTSARSDEETHLNAMRADTLKREMLSFIQKKRKEMENPTNPTSKPRTAVFASPTTVSPDASCQSAPRSQFVPSQSRYLSNDTNALPPLPSIHRPTIWKLHKWTNWDAKESKSTLQSVSYYESFLNASLDANNPETHKPFIIHDELASSPHLQFVPAHSVFLHRPANDDLTKDVVKDYSAVFSSLPPSEPKKKKKKKKKKKPTSDPALSDDSSSQSTDDDTPRHALLRSVAHAWRKYARRLKETPIEAGQLSLDATERIFFRDRSCPFESRRRLRR